MNFGLVGYFLNSVVEHGLFVHLRIKWLHNECLVLRGANLSTNAAACAVENRSYHSELHAGKTHSVLHLCTCRSLSSFFFGKNYGTDNCVRTNEWTLVTFDTVLGNPLGNVYCDTTLLISCRALGECTVSHAYECRYGELVASLSVNGDKDIVNEINEILSVTCSCVNGKCTLSVSPRCRNINLDNLACALFDCGVVHFNNVVTLLSEWLVSSLLHIFDSIFSGDDVSDWEECRL